MKKLLLILFLTLVAFGYSQCPIVTDSIKKVGIYRDFQEFKNNNPSIKLENPIVCKSITYNDLGGNSSMCSYAIDVDKEKGRAIGDVFGFCDGKAVYLIVTGYTNILSPNKIHNFNFFKVEYLGRYCYYDVVVVRSAPTGFGNPAMPAANLMVTAADKMTNVVDFNTNEIKTLTNSYLKKILADSPELLEKFKQQKSKSDYLKKYLIDYLKH